MTPQEFKSKRLELGFKNQGDLAEAIGISAKSISRLETGERNPSKIVVKFMQTLEKLKNFEELAKLVEKIVDNSTKG